MDKAVQVAVVKRSPNAAHWCSNPEQQLSPLVDLTLEGHGLIDVVDTYPKDEIWYYDTQEYIKGLGYLCLCFSCLLFDRWCCSFGLHYGRDIIYPFIVIRWYLFPNRERLPFIGCWPRFHEKSIQHLRICVDGAYQANSNSVWITDISREWPSLSKSVCYNDNHMTLSRTIYLHCK